MRLQQTPPSAPIFIEILDWVKEYLQQGCLNSSPKQIFFKFFIFQCQFFALPSRYKEDEQILPSQKYKMRYKNGKATLDIEDVHLDDGGLYTCKAIKKHGEVSTTAELDIQGKSQHSYQHPQKNLVKPGVWILDSGWSMIGLSIVMPVCWFLTAFIPVPVNPVGAIQWCKIQDSESRFYQHPEKCHIFWKIRNTKSWAFPLMSSSYICLVSLEGI